MDNTMALINRCTRSVVDFDYPFKGRYVFLSHCLGTRRPIKFRPSGILENSQSSMGGLWRQINRATDPQWDHQHSAEQPCQFKFKVSALNGDHADKGSILGMLFEARLPSHNYPP